MPNPTTTESCQKRFYRWGSPKPDRRRIAQKGWGTYKSERVACQEWAEQARSSYVSEKRIYELIDRALESVNLRLSATASLRKEFTLLADEWAQETKHYSLISKKITHPAYLRIIGMGRPVIPLLLEALRERPAHWFAALRATAGVDVSQQSTNPSAARAAWLEWGRMEGYID